MSKDLSKCGSKQAYLPETLSLLVMRADFKLDRENTKLV